MQRVAWLVAALGNELVEFLMEESKARRNGRSEHTASMHRHHPHNIYAYNIHVQLAEEQSQEKHNVGANKVKINKQAALKVCMSAWQEETTFPKGQITNREPDLQPFLVLRESIIQTDA